MRRFLSILVILSAMTSVALATGAPVVFTRNVQKHDQEYRATDHEMFNALVGPAIGGVIAQGSVVGPNGETDIVLSLPDSTEYAGEILVSFGDTAARLSIEYDLLVRAALFADGARTSLYTLWNEGDRRLPPGFPQRAGFLSAAPEDGMVAIEFRTPEYIDLLHATDVEMETCLSSEDEETQRSINSALENERQNPDFLHQARGDSYIVTDVGDPFSLIQKGAYLSLSGNLRSVSWEAEAGKKAFISLVLVYEKQACSASDAALLQSSVELFGVIALLRSARAHSELEFNSFMDSLSASPLLEANSEPWVAYTSAAKELYPELNE